jgi:uncharacterized protein YjbI with pentapeptide repeats
MADAGDGGGACTIPSRNPVTGAELRALIDAAPNRGRPVLQNFSLGGKTIVGDVSFEDVIFEGPANFGRVKFEGPANFGRVKFEGPANFSGAQFAGDADFRGAQVRGIADFGVARFSGASNLGPLSTTKSLVLNGAVFQEHVTVAVRAERLCAVGTRFQAGADIRAQSAEITFERATFGAASTVSTASGDTASETLLTVDCGKKTIPSVVSLRWARIKDLAFSLVDLRECEFRDAQGLEGLSLEQVLFDEMRGWHWHKKWPFPIRYTRRVAIAEEHRWRKENQRAPAMWPFKASEQRHARDSDKSDRPTPHQIVAVYRALRKGVEERKNEPGAGDWYYGEMEMRRHTSYTGPEPGERVTLQEAAGYDSTRRAPWGEKVVLFLYWLTSGYGLRASRALIALAVTIVCSAVLLSRFGFDDPRSYGRSLLSAVNSSISLLRAPSEKNLTDVGDVTTIALRLLGPLFFGLALLSLRGRIKR